MQYDPTIFFIAAFWGLSLSSPSQAQNTFTKGALETALESYTNGDAALVCDPFLDPGCNTPVVDLPPGCTDCAPGDVSTILHQQDKVFLMPNQIDIGDSTIILREQFDPGSAKAVKLKPQVGF